MLYCTYICDHLTWQKGHPKDRVSTISDTPLWSDDDINLDTETDDPSRRYTVDSDSASLGFIDLARGDGAPEYIFGVALLEERKSDDDDKRRRLGDTGTKNANDDDANMAINNTADANRRFVCWRTPMVVRPLYECTQLVKG